MTAPREATVKAVYFRGPKGPSATGGTSDVVVRVQPNAIGKLAIGVLESFSGGTGNQWKTAGWIAAFTASQQAGVGLSDNEFIVKVGGHIDGPSAGMLMTSTMLSLLKGTKLRPNTTMTGTINPDGSAGPVGGIVQKMDGAKKSGIKRFGFPIGTRTTKDLRNGQDVDLQAWGKQLGFEEVREIDNIEEAYEFMTGQKLRHAAPLADSDMEIPANLRQRLQAKIMAWKGRLEADGAAVRNEINKLPRKSRSAVFPWLSEYDKNFKKAKTYEASGLLPAAYRSYVFATIQLGMAKEVGRFLQHMSRGKLQDVDSQIQQLSAVDKMLEALRIDLTARSNRKTLGGQVSAVSGFQTYVTARSFCDQAKLSLRQAASILQLVRQKKLKRGRGVQKVFVQKLLMPVIYFSGAQALYQVAKDELDLVDEEGKKASVNLAALGKFAGAYGAAAGASLGYFDSLITEDLAKSKNMTKAQAMDVMNRVEPDYGIILQASRIAEWTGEGRVGTPKPEDSLYRLAAGCSAYLGAAGLVNKWYSLNAQQMNGKVVIKRRRALSSQLELAKKSARVAAADAKKRVGFVPSGAVLNYQMANALREGDDSEKLDALQSYWQSHFFSTLVVSLSKMSK